MLRFARKIAESFRRPALVPLWVLAIAAAVLLPDLPRPGLWEPHELAVADSSVSRAERAKHATDAPPAPAPPLFWARFKDPRLVAAHCATTAPADNQGARTLPDQLASLGLRVSETDGGMRMPGALLGILCVLAVAGIAIRTGGARAGLFAGLACLSFPIFVLDARMLDGDIGTPTAGALIVYGAVTLATLRPRAIVLVDMLVAFAAITVGAWLGFLAGGALLGLFVPAIAIACADGFGLGLFSARSEDPARAPRQAITLIATLASAAAVYVLASEIYDWVAPMPGQRELFGHSVIASDCYSPALGGLWKVDDDLRMGLDSVFEQIAFGTFPVGLVAVIAAIALAVRPTSGPGGYAGRLALAWAGAAWIATQVWNRKVGLALWPGFPALALALGVWLDQLLAARERADQDPGYTGVLTRVDDLDGGAAAPPLLAMFAFAAIVTVAVDVLIFPDRVTSLLVGADTVKYPLHARLFGVQLRACAAAAGGVFAILFACGAWLWRPATGDRRHPAFVWLGRWGTQLSIAMMAVLAAFWVFGWHDGLSSHLSSKHVFNRYRELRKDGDVLGVMGDMGNAPRYYADGPYERLPGRDQLLTFLARPARVFAMVPATELCSVHRAAQGKPYYVLDDSNPRTLLFSNQLGGTVDLNPLRTTVLRTEPQGIKKRPPAPIVYDDKIELIGWDVPDEAPLDSTFKVTLYFHVKAAVPGSWQIFQHFDPATGARFVGDHFPVHNTCATSYWQAGDYIVDENEVISGGVGFGAGVYELWVGFFTGSNPNWTNMKVSAAPAGWKDNADRVHIGSVTLD